MNVTKLFIMTVFCSGDTKKIGVSTCGGFGKTQKNNGSRTSSNRERSVIQTVSVDVDNGTGIGTMMICFFWIWDGESVEAEKKKV